MNASDTVATIAAQIHNVKPDHYVPGVDVIMEPFSPITLAVGIKPLHLFAAITYEEGPDTYAVKVWNLSADEDGSVLYTLKEEGQGVYCDDLGRFLFGDEAKPFTLPMFSVTTWDDDGNATTERIA